MAFIPIPIFMCLWAIYIFPGSVHIFSCSKIGRPIIGIYKSLTDTWNVEIRTEAGRNSYSGNIRFEFPAFVSLQCTRWSGRKRGDSSVKWRLSSVSYLARPRLMSGLRGPVVHSHACVRSGPIAFWGPVCLGGPVPPTAHSYIALHLSNVTCFSLCLRSKILYPSCVQ